MFSRMDILKAPAIRNKANICRQQQLPRLFHNRKCLLFPKQVIPSSNNNSLSILVKLRIRFSKGGMDNLTWLILIIIRNNILMSFKLDFMVIPNLLCQILRNLVILINKDTLSTLCNSKKLTL